MAKGYWLAAYRSISDQNALQEYAKLAGPAVTANGGRFLVRGTLASTSSCVSTSSPLRMSRSMSVAFLGLDTAADQSKPISDRAKPIALRRGAANNILALFGRSLPVT